MKSLRILVVGQTPPPYGGQAVMIQLLLEGAYTDIELVHVRMNFSQELDSAGKFRLAKVFELFRVVIAIYRTKFKFHPEVLYYPPAGPHLFPVLRDVVILGLTRWLFRTTVFHFHASNLSEFFQGMTPLLRKPFQIAFARPDLAIQISSKAPADGRNLGCKREIIVPNGIPDDAGEYIARSIHAGSRIKLLFVALLCEGTGVLVAIQAVPDLMRAGADIELTGLGKWESREFEGRAAALIEQQFRPRFNFPGVVIGAEKWEYYRDAHIFLYPSFVAYDTFPVVLLEAMCFSLPIVSTTWHGIPDLVEEGSCAFLCQPRDVECCREALRILISDSSLRNNMGKHSRERFLRHFTVEQYRRAMERAFASLRG
jgi:glycosyltransferase involved in cell wall biosynthesis